MGDKTKIEWSDATWTPIRARNLATGKIGWHCEHVTSGCENCYSESLNKVYGTGLPFKPGHRKDVEIFLDEKMLTAPLRWQKPRMIFVCSMTDLFADFVKDEWIDRMFAVMALAPQHTFQVLTKRSARMLEYCSGGSTRQRVDIARAQVSEGRVDDWKLTAGHWPLPNVWLGVSAEDQARADERVPDLLATLAAVRFVSAEPLLSSLDLSEWLREKLAALDWIICGSESGPRARPMDLEWARSIQAQCAGASVPFFMKQLSGPGGRAVKDMELFPADLRVREMPRIPA